MVVVDFNSIQVMKLMAGWFSQRPSCDFGGIVTRVVCRVTFILAHETIPAKSRFVVKEVLFLSAYMGVTWGFFEAIIWIEEESQHDEEVS